jgi:hypothetical protein
MRVLPKVIIVLDPGILSGRRAGALVALVRRAIGAVLPIVTGSGARCAGCDLSSLYTLAVLKR